MNYKTVPPDLNKGEIRYVLNGPLKEYRNKKADG